MKRTILVRTNEASNRIRRGTESLVEALFHVDKNVNQEIGRVLLKTTIHPAQKNVQDLTKPVQSHQVTVAPPYQKTLRLKDTSKFH
jgi:hypothetical protein